MSIDSWCDAAVKGVCTVVLAVLVVIAVVLVREERGFRQRLAAEYQYSIEATSTKGGYDYNGAELLVRKRLDAAMGLNNYIIHDERYNGKFYYSCHETNKYTAAGCKICQREADRLRRIQDEQRYK